MCFLSRSNNCRVDKTCVPSSAQSLAVPIIETLGFVPGSMFLFLTKKNKFSVANIEFFSINLDSKVSSDFVWKIQKGGN